MSFDEILDLSADVFFCFIIMSKVHSSSQQELLSWCFFDHVFSNINKLWLLLCHLRVPFAFHQLASPLRFHVTRPKEEPWTLHIYYVQASAESIMCRGGELNSVRNKHAIALLASQSRQRLGWHKAPPTPSRSIPHPRTQSTLMYLTPTR